jgi:Lrp/AsnC family leucine-responsive transcriptional regulator
MWAVGVEGPYDFGMFVHTKTIKEMNTLWQGFEERFREHIEEVQFAVQTHITSYARQYLVSNARNTFSRTMYSEPSPEPLDSIDMGILKCLSNDARIPVIELASELKTTAKTIIAHLKHLESSEVITAYRPNIDVNAIGYDYFKIELKLFNTTPVRLKALDQYIEEHPQIVYRDWALGGADIEIEVHVKGMPGLRELLNDIMNKFAPIIQDTRTMHFYQEYKYYFVPFETKDGKV